MGLIEFGDVGPVSYTHLDVYKRQHLVGDKAGDLNDLLTHGGFRRSQSIAYRPACDQCRACVSVRVVANEFRPSRNFRKIMARNADVVGEQRSAVPTSEQYSVFRA